MSIRECPRLLPDLYGKNVETTWRVGADSLCSLEDGAKKIADLPDVMQIEERYLDAMAEDRQTYWTQLADTAQRKRALIRDTLQIHAKKGTAWAIKQAFAALYLQAEVLPWYLYGGEPYHYRIDIATHDREITTALHEAVEKMVDELGAVRDVSDGATLSYLVPATLHHQAGIVGEANSVCLPIDGYQVLTPATLSHQAGIVGEVYIKIGGNT